MSDRFIKGNEKKYVLEVLETGNLAPFGPMTRRYEKAFAEKMGVKYAFAITSTQAAMQVGLNYGGVGPGDEVITDATAYFSTQAILYMNAVPVYADIDRETFNIDPKSIEERIISRTRAIICTHIFGLPCEMDEIMDIAKRHNLVVIEDCAQSINAVYKGQKVGTFGSIGCFCIHDSKQISSGDGGMATTNDDRMAEEIQMMRQSDWLDSEQGVGRKKRAMRIGLNLPCTELQAAIGLAQIERIEDILRPEQEKTQKISEFWLEMMGDKPYFLPQKIADYKTHACWHYAMKYVGNEYGVPLEKLREASEKKGWGLTFGYSKPVYFTGRIKTPGIYSDGCPLSCPYYDGKIEYEKGLCPVLENTYWRLVGGLGLGDRAKDIHKTFWSLREKKSWSVQSKSL